MLICALISSEYRDCLFPTSCSYCAGRDTETLNNRDLGKLARNIFIRETVLTQYVTVEQEKTKATS